MSLLSEMVQALLQPDAYPHRPEKVELVQTQMSFVFLAGEYVYKVKKPVDLGYLDYTTLEKRRYFCQQELKLNRRLCADAYLGVVPIVKHGASFTVEGEGSPVEYAVKMRRLPGEAMLDRLLAEDKAMPEMLARVADKLADFHEMAETNAAISAFGDLATIRQNTEENFNQTEKSIGRTISLPKYERIKRYTNEFIQKNAALFQERKVNRRIRDCHGDLHAAHICFCNGICIYDCIEFNDRFRYADVASEVAFLAMDLDHHGRADLARHFVDAYVARSGDTELKTLLAFYKCYRAYVRGKVESFKLDDPYISDEDKINIRDVASSYFHLSHAYTWSRPILFITVGLVGTGKSTLSRALAGRLGLVVLSSDITRKRLAGIPLTEHRFQGFHGGIYTPEFTRKTYDAMFAKAGKILSDGGRVLLDASFIHRDERLRAKELAEKSNARFIVLECRLDEGSILRYLEQRQREGSVSDGRAEILEPQKKRFDPLTEVSEREHIVVDISLPEEEKISATLKAIEDRVTG
jgi:aminoglycoside phosphotransferase family enzyme/predicted kinase